MPRWARSRSPLPSSLTTSRRSWTPSRGLSPPRPRAPTFARPRFPAPWDRASGSRRRCIDEQDRTTRYGAEPDGTVPGLTEHLRYRLQRPERAEDDGVPSPPPGGRRLLHRGEEHPGPAGARREFGYRPGRPPGWAHRAGASREGPGRRCQGADGFRQGVREAGYQDRVGGRATGHGGSGEAVGQSSAQGRAPVAVGRGNAGAGGPAGRRAERDVVSDGWRPRGASRTAFVTIIRIERENIDAHHHAE